MEKKTKRNMLMASTAAATITATLMYMNKHTDIMCKIKQGAKDIMEDM